MVGPVDKTPKETPLHTNKAVVENFVQGRKEALGAGKPKFSTFVPKELLEKVTQVIAHLFKKD
jgi:hypothetical protein